MLHQRLKQVHLIYAPAATLCDNVSASLAESLSTRDQNEVSLQRPTPSEISFNNFESFQEQTP